MSGIPAVGVRKPGGRSNGGHVETLDSDALVHRARVAPHLEQRGRDARRRGGEFEAQGADLRRRREHADMARGMVFRAGGEPVGPADGTSSEYCQNCLTRRVLGGGDIAENAIERADAQRFVIRH